MSKILIDRSTVEQALEALDGGGDSWQRVGPAIDALKAALADPVQAKPWVGLTEAERTDICDGYGANIHWRAFRAIEAKLQEKNT